MSEKGKWIVVPATSAACAVILAGAGLWFLLRNDPAADVVMSVPGMDGAKANVVVSTVKFGGVYENFAVSPGKSPGYWPQFRGEKRDNISSESVKLAGTFDQANPPKPLWSVKVCEGYASPAVFKGRVYLSDYLESTSNDVVRCLSLDDGKEIWRCGYRVKIRSNHGITRTMPSVTDKYVVNIGPLGHVMCLDTDTGRVQWGIDLMKEYGTRDMTKQWYTGQCPLIDSGAAVVAPGGSNVLMMAVSCDTGKVLWKAPNPKNWKISHSSISIMTVAGTRMYVYAAVGGVAGVAADGPSAGKILWLTDEWTSSVVMPSPVAMEDGRLFLSSGYDGGGAVLQIVKEGDEFKTRMVYNFKGRGMSEKCFSTYQQTAIYFQKHLFGIQLNTAREHRMEFVCVDPLVEGGKFVWFSGKDETFTSPKGKEAWGPYVLADGKFYVMDDTGRLVVFEATTEKCNKLGEVRLMNGHETWGPLVITGGRLLMRDFETLSCFDISSKQ